jgi:hypothetical protein
MRMKKLLLILTISLGVTWLWQYLSYKRSLAHITEQAISESISETDAVVARLEQELSTIEKVAEYLLESGIWELPVEQQVAMMRKAMRNNSHVFGIGLIHDEGQAQGTDIYIAKNRPSQFLLSTDSTMQAEERNWYAQFKQSPQTWGDSLLIKGAQTRRIQMGRLVGEQDNPKGAIFIHLSLREVQLIVSSARLGKAGYGFVISQSGKFIHHPVSQWAVEGRSIYEVGYAPFNEQIRSALSKVGKGEKELLEFANPLNGQYSWYFFESIAGTNWVMGATFFKEEMVNNIVNKRKTRVLLALLAVSFGVGVLLSLYFWLLYHWHPYKVTTNISVLLLFGII